MLTSAQRWMAWAVVLTVLIVGTWVTVVLSELSQQCGPEWISLTADAIAVLVTLIAAVWVLIRAVASALRGEWPISEGGERVTDGYHSVRDEPFYRPYRYDEPHGDQRRW